MKGVSARAYSTNYFQRLTLESWYTNLQQMLKQTGMLVISLGGVNFGFWIFSLKQAHYMSYLCAFKRFLLGVKICLSHAQMVSFRG